MLTLKDQKFGTMYGTALFFMRPFFDLLAKADARRWIGNSLEPSDEEGMCECSLKAIWESASDHKLLAGQFLELLDEAGYVKAGAVYANLK